MTAMPVLLLSLTALLLALQGPLQTGATGCGRSLVPECGQPVVQPASHRIVGGQEVQRGSWPWTVVLFELGFAACGGAIISDRVILTAAHCFENPVSWNASRWTVRAGKHSLLKTDRGEMSFPVEKIVLHEHYTHSMVENDIALMVVSDSIPFTTFIRPICVPRNPPHAALPPGTACLMAGWGDTKASRVTGTGPPGILMEVLVPVVSDDVCGLPGWYYNQFIPQKTFCAGYEEGRKDSCAGDSGGPLISKLDDRWYVSGIASWGFGCAEPRWPGVYTNVTYYLPWIHTQLTAVGLPGLCDDSIVG